MFRKFFRDERGNYALMTVIALVPLMGALVLAVDYTEISRQRQDTLNALDAAGLATARYIASGASDTQAIAYANDFFKIDLRHVDPVNTTLTVLLPKNNTGGGTLKMCATLTYSPYFLPAAAWLIGRESRDFTFDTCTEIRLKNTLEVALVLDNSTSMNTNGGTTGKPRMDLLKKAAKELVNTLALQAEQMKQVDKPVQFSLVPFAASVNIGPDNKDKSWMDLDGISPIHHENFDWSAMTSGTKYVQKSGDIYYMRGTGWGDNQNKPMTRFKLYELMQKQTCKQTKSNGTQCKTLNTPEQYEEWAGCVESRPSPYNSNDTTPTSGTPATLFVPMFAPDEPGNFWRDIDGNGTNDVDNSSWSVYSNNWWVDSSDSLTVTKRQRDARKYFMVKPWNASTASSSKGPNASCTTKPLTPLQDVTTDAGKKKITDAIDAMKSNGYTNVPEGIAWGWRTVSSNEPFTEGRPNTDKGNDKVVIVLTDGANTYDSVSDASYVGNRSTYAAYGYAGLIPSGDTTSRLFRDTDSTVGKSTYTDDNYTAALNWHMKTVCQNAKDSNILVMTVSLDLDPSQFKKKADKDLAQAQIDGLKTCSSDSRYRRDPSDPTKPAKLYWNATSDNLSQKFQEIADELSNLRIVK